MATGVHPNVRRFYERHLPGAEPQVSFLGNIGLREEFGRIPRLSRGHAHAYLTAIVDDAAAEFGGLPYPRFEKLLLSNLKKIVRLDGEITPKARRLLAEGPPHAQFFYLLDIFRHLPYENSLAQKLRDARLNVRHSGKWLELPEERAGAFAIRHHILAHPESPMFLLAERVGGKRQAIATVGFHLLSSPGGRTTLSINNIQGVSGKAADLDLLSRKLGAKEGESWRDEMTRRVIAYARRRGFRVEGELPPRQRGIGLGEQISEEEYARQVKRYKQLYRRLGFEQIGDGKYLLPGTVTRRS